MPHGAVAQLGERQICILDVRGSSPLSSTMDKLAERFRFLRTELRRLAVNDLLTREAVYELLTAAEDQTLCFDDCKGMYWCMLDAGHDDQHEMNGLIWDTDNPPEIAAYEIPTTITLKQEDYDRFMEALKNPPPPTQALIDLFKKKDP